MSQVLDYYSSKPKDTLAAFKASGADGIARYLTSSKNDIRQVTKQEIADAHSLGLAVHFFYEENPTYPNYFSYAQGAEDCRQAQDRLKELGAPDGTVVYFTVDVNLDPRLTDAYFNGVESAVTPAIIPGAYGYQRFCEYAKANFPNIGRRLFQTYGTPTVPLDGFQHLQEERAGVQVDVNEVSVPGWKPLEVDMTRDETIALLAEYGLTPDKGKVPAIDAALGNFSYRISAIEHGSIVPPTAPNPPTPHDVPVLPPIYTPGHGPQ